MGWLDKGFKNLLKGGKELLSSPAGIMALGVLAPYAMPWMKGLGATKGLGMLKSPMISNALKNAAMNYGIATLTGSKHPGKAALWAGAASLPFTYMQGAQAAGQYNKLYKTSEAFTGLDKANQAQVLAGDWSGAGLADNPMMNWADFALGKDMAPLNTLGSRVQGDLTGVRDIPRITPKAETLVGADAWADVIPPAISPDVYTGPDPHAWKFTYDMPRENIPIDLSGVQDTASSYFTRDVAPGTLDKLALNPGIAGLGPMMGLEGIDLMSSIIPQIAGLYGGRMSQHELWEAAKEKQIRMWAFQFGIPYEEAKELWKEGWKNPYYETQTPHDYGPFRNRGGYIDDYTAGGKAVGPGTGKSDSIQPVALSNGEFVFTEEATNNFPGGADGLYSLMNRLDPESETPQEARA